jgi:hypothetical protein
MCLFLGRGEAIHLENKETVRIIGTYELAAWRDKPEMDDEVVNKFNKGYERNGLMSFGDNLPAVQSCAIELTAVQSCAIELTAVQSCAVELTAVQSCAIELTAVQSCAIELT